ncbi:MAG: DsbA family protein [Rhodobacterales bacterium]|nr:DsbA family protein [Rhodobacterales bacterium]
MRAPRLMAAALALALAGPVQALDLTAMTPAEREAFGAEVRAYLLSNPQVLMEAIAVLEQQDQANQAAADLAMLQANAEAIFRDPASWADGNLDGDITVVEFVDYRCSYCRRAHDEVAELVKSDGNIRLVLKEFPILGDDSVLASRFAIAVLQLAGPEAYKRVHDALITLRGAVNDQSLTRLAQDQGLDAAAILARMSAPEVEAVIAANRQLASLLQISGTPTFVIDQTMVRGYVPLDGMRQIVAGQRAD